MVIFKNDNNLKNIKNNDANIICTLINNINYQNHINLFIIHFI